MKNDIIIENLEANTVQLKKTVSSVADEIKKGHEKLSESVEKLKPSLDAANFLANFMKAIKGEKGAEGYTPIKGKDYFTKEDLSSIKKEIRPIKGKDYFDGKDGKDGERGLTGKDGRDGLDGYTPIKGKDYFTSTELSLLKKEITPTKGIDYFDGKDGRSPKHKIDHYQLQFENPDGTWGEIINFANMFGAAEGVNDIKIFSKGSSKKFYAKELEIEGGTITSIGSLVKLSLSSVSSFSGLTDTPSSYSGDGGKVLAVKSDESGIEFRPSTSSDEKVKYKATDPTAGYISDKFVAGSNIILTEGTGGNVNKLVISGDQDLSTYATLIGVETLTNKTITAPVINTPTGIVKSDVGLGNVDNTSDANKPISTATQTALDGKVDENTAITGATKTKITYDSKGLVTSGADATTADIADSTDKRYITDAQQTVLGNTSGTNTGDQTLPVKATGTELDTGTDDAKFATAKALADSKYVKKDETATLTNKTLTDSTNNIMAKSLKSATTTVDVSGSTAPTTGQVLTATGGTAATWQTPSGGGTAPNFIVGNSTYDYPFYTDDLSVIPNTRATSFDSLYLKNKSLITPLFINTTGQTVAASLIWSAATKVQGAVVSSGYIYAFLFDDVNSVARIYICQKGVDITSAANWTQATISGTALPTDTASGLIGFGDGNIWISDSTNSRFVPYSISSTTLTSSTSITVTGASYDYKRNRVNKNGIYAYFTTTPMLRKADFTGNLTTSSFLTAVPIPFSYISSIYSYIKDSGGDMYGYVQLD